MPRLIPIKSSHIWQRVPAFSPAAVPGGLFWYKMNPGYVTVADGLATTFTDAFGNGNNISAPGAAPIYLDYNTTDKNYVYFPGTDTTTTNYCTTPDAPANQFVDIDIRAIIQFHSYNSVQQIIIQKEDIGSGNGWFFGVMDNAHLRFQSVDMVGFGFDSISTDSLPAADGQKIQVRVTFNHTTGDVKFYYRLLSTDPFIQLGDTEIFLGSAIKDVATDLIVGLDFFGAGYTLGKIFDVTLRKVINGSITVHFDPNKGTCYDNSFDAVTGETWIIDTDSAPGFKCQLVDRALTQFDGLNTTLQNLFTDGQPVTIYILYKDYLHTDSTSIYDGGSRKTMQLTNHADPDIFITADGVTQLDNVGNAASNTFWLITAIFNGANSFLQVNQIADPGITGDAGPINNPNGFAIGSDGGGGQSNICLIEVVGYSAAHSLATRTALQNNIASRNHYTLT